MPAKVREEWSAYRSFLSSLNNLSIPRKILNSIKGNEIESHSFADANEVTYNCCVCMRCINESGENTTSLLCVKSKEAPLKALSLPRLEL